MKKADFIKLIAEKVDISQATASACVDGTLAAITQCLKDGESITFVGFGTFSVKHRAARKGRNPRTGETIEIKAANVPAFKAGKALKEALN
jgi:nucleoid DNA-binding protein